MNSWSLGFPWQVQAGFRKPNHRSSWGGGLCSFSNFSLNPEDLTSRNLPGQNLHSFAGSLGLISPGLQYLSI
jgi:hypothetical protein